MIISHAHIHVAADAVAEVIGAFGFEQEYHALQVETGSDGKPRFTHQPFLEVGDSLKPPAACTLAFACSSGIFDQSQACICSIISAVCLSVCPEVSLFVSITVIIWCLLESDMCSPSLEAWT